MCLGRVRVIKMVSTSQKLDEWGFTPYHMLLKISPREVVHLPWAIVIHLGLTYGSGYSRLLSEPVLLP